MNIGIWIKWKKINQTHFKCLNKQINHPLIIKHTKKEWKIFD